jgi:hypothetical protein
MNLRLLFLILLWLNAASGFAQETAAHAQTHPPLPPLQVIESLEVQRGNKTTIYQRVVPPVRPAPTATPLPSARPSAAVPLTAEQQRQAAMKSETLLLMATVHEQRVTELCWQQRGREYRAWSNIDFNHLAGVSEIETAETIYTLLLGASDITAAEAEAFNRAITERGLPAALLKQLPPPERFPAGRSGYVMAADLDALPVPGETTALLDALHT